MVVDGDVPTFVFGVALGVAPAVLGVTPVPTTPDGVVDGDVLSFVPGVVPCVALVPAAPVGDVVDGGMVGFVFGVATPGPVVPGAPPLLASLPLPA